MADVSKLKFENGTYDIKDTQAREQLTQVEEFPALGWEIASGLIESTKYEYGDVRRFGIVGDYDSVTNVGTNNYEKLSQLLNVVPEKTTLYFNELDYYFEGATGFDTDKSIELSTKCPDAKRITLRIKTVDGFGITLRGRDLRIYGITIKGFDNTKGVGLRIIGASPYYVAYCVVENVQVQGGFNTGFYSGDSFFMEYSDCLANGDLRIGFNFSNVATTLKISRCYALDCLDYGYIINQTVYSILENCASDGCGLSYRLQNVHSLVMTSCGSERHQNTALIVIDSQVTINGFTGDMTRGTGSYSTMVNLQNSMVDISNLRENAIHTEGTTSTSSIVVDETSRLNVRVSSVLKNIYVGNGGIIDGDCKVGGVIHSYKNSQRILYGDDLPTSGVYKIGDKLVNTNPNLNDNPVVEWVCVAGGTGGEWRPSRIIEHRGASAYRPTLSGYKHLGVRYFDTTLNSWIVWNSTKWTKFDGTDVT